MSRPVEVRGIGTASGQGLSSTLALIPIAGTGKMIGRGKVTLTPRNNSGAVVMRYTTTPRLAVLKVTDSLAGLPTDYSDNAQDGASGTVVTLDALPPNPKGYLYLGGSSEFRGVQVGTPGNANAVASTLTAEYWNGTAWASLGLTDGTATGGATFAQAGNITWTIPAAAAWKPSRLLESAGVVSAAAFLGSADPASAKGLMGLALWWVRLKTSAAFSAPTDVASIMALARSTAYAEAPISLTTVVSNPVTIEADSLNTTPYGVGAIEALTDGGTANLVASLQGEFLT